MRIDFDLDPGLLFWNAKTYFAKTKILGSINGYLFCQNNGNEIMKISLLTMTSMLLVLRPWVTSLHSLLLSYFSCSFTLLTHFGTHGMEDISRNNSDFPEFHLAIIFPFHSPSTWNLQHYYYYCKLKFHNERTTRVKFVGSWYKN